MKRHLKKIWYSLPILILSVVCLLMLKNIQYKKTTSKKQIILISIDTLRADHLPFYGYERDTSPNLSKLVKQSSLYTNAYTNSPWTYPSHMTLLTGTLPSRHGLNEGFVTIAIHKKYPVLDDSILTIAEILKRNNLNTIKIFTLSEKVGFGRGFDKKYHMDSFCDDDCETILREIEDNKNQDFFIFAHTWLVHAPYPSSHFLKPETKESLGIEDIATIDNFKVDAKEYKQVLFDRGLFNRNDCIDLYDGGIYKVDQYIKKIIDKCKQLDIYDDILLAIVSDHGEHFGEHHPKKFYNSHGWGCYEELIRVPFIIKFPLQSKPKVDHSPVALVDFVPTILDYYNIEIPHFVQGKSLINGISRDFIITEASSLPTVEKKMILKNDLKYFFEMKNPSGPGRVNWKSIKKRRLFNLKTDPFEKTNLAKKSLFDETIKSLEKLLIDEITESTKLCASKNQAELLEETIEQLKALGYLQ